MLGSNKREPERCNDNSFEINILEQGFFQLPKEAKLYLKNYLQDLLSIQNSIAGGKVIKEKIQRYLKHKQLKIK